MITKLIKNHKFLVLLLSLALTCLPAGNSRADEDSKYLNTVREFADNVLKYGRDTYGPKHTPLFVDGLNVYTHEPVKWIAPNGDRWILSNLASQQNLFRTLDGLTKITGDPKYRQAAMEAIEYAFENLQVLNGLLSWGVGSAYDAQTDRKYVRHHILHCNYPYYELMWEVDSSATKQFIETFWSAHILDWSNLDMNRYEMVSERFENPWQHEYKGGPVFFRSKIRNGISFMSTGSDLYYAAALLCKLSGEKEPLLWSKRLANRYVETRNAKTGISGCIYNLRQTDQAMAQFGDDFRGHIVNLGTIFPVYPQLDDYVHPTRSLTVSQPSRTRFRGFGMRGGAYHGLRPWICQLLLGEIMGGDGKEFNQWALEELTAIGKVAYRKKDNSFIPMLTDGASLEGYVYTKDGYYGPKGITLKVHWAGSIPFWAYALGYRLTADEFMWEMVRDIAEGNGFGDIGTLAGSGSKLEMETNCSDAYVLMGFLELYSKTQNVSFLKMASRIGDNILAERFYRGFFVPTKNHLYTRFDYIEPLVLLKLEATARTKPTLTPQVWPGASYFMYNYRGMLHVLDVDFIYTLTESTEPPLTLPEAAGSGDINEVKSLIAKSVDLNVWDPGPSYRPLPSAVINGHKQVVELLIAKGADVKAGDDANKKPLHYAAEKGHKEIAELLIAHGADVNAKDNEGRTPLHCVAEEGYTEIAELLIAHGADINAKDAQGWTPLDLAMERGHQGIIRLLSKSGDVSISINMAAYAGDLQRVEKFIDEGADVDAKDEEGQTALHHAAKGADIEMVELLIAKGADVNAKDNDSRTPLCVAVWGGHKDVVELLIDNCADINARGEHYYTPIYYAAWSGSTEMVEFLVEKGADVNAKDEWGWTPLHYLAKDNLRDMAELFITKGADVNAEDKWGETPLQYASRRGHTEIADLLREQGAKEEEVKKEDGVSKEEESLVTPPVDINKKAYTYQMPLHKAAAEANLERVKSLISSVADINAESNEGWTALHRAAVFGHVDVVRLLLAHGAKVNTVNRWGWAPLHSAALYGHKTVVALLLANGADISAKTPSGETPMQIAKERGYKKVAELLRKHRAKE